MPSALIRGFADYYQRHFAITPLIFLVAIITLLIPHFRHFFRHCQLAISLLLPLFIDFFSLRMLPLAISPLITIIDTPFSLSHTPLINIFADYAAFISLIFSPFSSLYYYFHFNIPDIDFAS